jgi:hypothetical protein
MMRHRLVTTLSVSVLVAASATVGLGVSAGASVAAKKPPVKIEGGATNKGTKTVKGDATSIEADDSYFEKTFQKVTAGQTVSVTIENEGSAQHTFTIDSLNIDEVLNSGDSTTVEVVVPADGATVVFYCRFHGDPGKMKGAFFTKTRATTSSSLEDSGSRNSGSRNSGSGSSGSGSDDSGGYGGY